MDLFPDAGQTVGRRKGRPEASALSKGQHEMASARVGATHKGLVMGGWEPILPKDVMNKMNLARP